MPSRSEDPLSKRMGECHQPPPDTQHQPHPDPQHRRQHGRVQLPPTRERIYRDPKPTIPDFTSEDPRQFARLKLSLENILPDDATECFKYQILVEHLKFEEALLIADSYCNSLYPFTSTMDALSDLYGQPH